MCSLYKETRNTYTGLVENCLRRLKWEELAQVCNFKGLGYAIREFNFTVTMLTALDCYNPIPDQHLHYILCFILAELGSYTRDGKQPKHTKIKPFIILFYLDTVAAISTTVVTCVWHLDLCTQNSQTVSVECNVCAFQCD